MTDQEQGAAEGLPEPGPVGRESAWATDDMALDARARTLLLRLVDRDDGAALAALIELMEARLLQLQDAVLDELGAGVSMPLADEWFAAHLVGSRSSADVPLHPLAAAYEWMKARGQAIVNALSAQPLPWEDGHDGSVLDHWLTRLGVPEPTTPALRVALVCHHRLSEAARQVLRDLQIAGLSVARCAERRGLSPGAVEDLYREGRLASARALERLQGGAHDAD